MHLLIDTHLLLWWLRGDSALSMRVRDFIGDSENTLFVIAVRFWEIWLRPVPPLLAGIDQFPDCGIRGSVFAGVNPA